MPPFRFTDSARQDLLDIWAYTQETWGEAQADRYQDDILACCERIAAGTSHSKCISGIESVKSSRCRHHVLFFVESEDGPIFVAVLNERMDLIARLIDRL